MTIPPITVVLDPPLISDPANFETKADALLNVGLPDLSNQINDVVDGMNEAVGTINTVFNGAGFVSAGVGSVAMASGAFSLTLDPGLQLGKGMRLTVAVTASPTVNWMEAGVDAYDNVTGDLDFTVPSDGVTGSGTYSAWTVSLSGPRGEDGKLVIPPEARTSNTALAGADSGKRIEATGTFTQTFLAAATLQSGWFLIYSNLGTGVITLDPNGAETIDGVASFAMYPGESRMIFNDGAALRSIVLKPFYIKATSSFTFVMPPGYAGLDLDLIGGGGGGGSGARGANNALRTGGAPGGAPARVLRRMLGVAVAASYAVAIGAAGTPGAAQTTNSTAGINGVAGGNTTFGALFTAYGGAAGLGGLLASAQYLSTSGSGALSAGVCGTGNQDGGEPTGYYFGRVGTVTGSENNLGDGGGAGAQSTGPKGGCTYYGGAGSGWMSAGSAYNAGNMDSGSSLFGVAAASPGGWLDTSNAYPTQAPNAGKRNNYSQGGGALGGTCGTSPTAGAAGTAPVFDDDPGEPGAGGGSNPSGPGASGGDGSEPGGPGGGGGASVNGQPSGAGGAGKKGRAIIKGVI